ncbi:restriction endonuclease subunit S [Thomasclavelia spiroformis]|uniref:restriction endonuclease subunit S n=1 Tax=Thomasclavelia spiroformis TaxID=29348 RepID=UPI00255BBC3B|nr:restriction endonuclease subunit S [Thomasclavelia spiroformis]
MKKLSNYIKSTIDNRGKNPKKYFEIEQYPVIDNYLIKNTIFPDLSAVNRYIDKNTYDNFLRGYVHKNMPIMTLVGNGIGNVTLAPSNDVAIIQNTIGFECNDNIDEVFLYYYFLYRQEFIRKFDRGSGQPSIRKTDLLEMEVSIPDITEQIRIKNILFDIDKKIELNKTINNNLEQQAQALFKSWFVDFEPFDGKIPDVWKSGVLGDFVEIKRGGSPRPIQNYLSDSGLHWLKISDATSISSPFINEIKEYIIEEGLKKTVFLKAGNLVLSNSATPGLPKILDIDTCIHDGWLYFPSSKLSNEYLYLYFKYIRNNLVALGNGSVFTNLKTDILKNYPTNLPSADVLNEFDGIIKPIFSMILSNTRETRRLTEIRDILLPKLMSGEIDVSNIEF